MQIVIEISDYDREFIKNAYSIPEEIRQKTAEAIINGITLPKGHGDLVDRDLVLSELKSIGSRDYRREKGTICEAIKIVDWVEEIITADKEDADGE